MLRSNTSVGRQATDTPRARSGRPRIGTPHSRVSNHEVLRPSDVGLGQLFTLTREAVVVGNVETGRIALWNPAAERLFGWSAAEAVGRPLEILIPPAIMRLHQAGLDLYRQTGHGTVIESHRRFEVPALTMRGEEIRVELSLATLDDPSSPPGRYVVALLGDVSDRRRAELQSREFAELESARQDAERALRRHGQVVQEHLGQLRRALSRLQRSADRLSHRVVQPHAARSELQARVVEIRTERLRRQLEALAISTAIESNILELKLERVNLVPLMNRVVARTRSRGTPHKLNVAFPQGLTALIDSERIAQVVDVLIDHALARSPRGSWIDIDLRRPLAGLARIEIRDYGRPVTSDVRTRLLEGGDPDPGLALARSIVDLHGGTLGFEFAADGGVRAIVTLPTQRGRVFV